LPAPLHIVLLDYRDVTHPEAGGAEQYLNELFQRIAAHGHRVTLIAGRYRGAAAEEQIGGIQVRRTGNKATFNFAGARAALRLTKTERVDLLVENLCKIPYFLPAFTRVPVLPIVLHLFGATVFQEANPAFATYVWLYEQLIPPVYRGLRFVAISQSTARDLERRGVRSTGTDIIEPGIDLDHYRVDPAVRKSPQPLLLYVGMLKRYKGLDIVLRAFARLHQKIPDAQLVLAGRGNDRERLQGLARSLAIEEAVRFVGWISEEDKLAWLRRAHALVYPSLKEGWGIPTIEAAACATPTLASDVDGLRDAVRDGVTGYLIPHLDTDAWARRMIEILTDEALRSRLAAGAQQWASGFGWDGQAEKMRRVVEEVALAAARPRREERVARTGGPDP
jgi:glycosyltransferase involved in cell wall biosynthesis